MPAFIFRYISEDPAVTHLRERETYLYCIQKIPGHESSKTPEIYACAGRKFPGKIKSLLRTLNPKGKGKGWIESCIKRGILVLRLYRPDRRYPHRGCEWWGKIFPVSLKTIMSVLKP